MDLFVSEVVIIIFVTFTLNTIIPLIRNITHKINSKTDSSASYPKNFSESLTNFENLSVPTESDIEIFITGMITPKPTSSIIELINDRIMSKNKPNFDLKKQILNIS